MKTKSQNITIAKKAIEMVKRYLKSRYKHPVIEPKSGPYDLQCGKLYFEVKGTEREKLPYAWLTEGEYDYANRHSKNYRLIVVNVNTGERVTYKFDYIKNNRIKKILYRVDFGKNREIKYRNNLKSVNPKSRSTKWTRRYTLNYKRKWMQKHKHLSNGGYVSK